MRVELESIVTHEFFGFFHWNACLHFKNLFTNKILLISNLIGNLAAPACVRILWPTNQIFESFGSKRPCCTSKIRRIFLGFFGAGGCGGTRPSCRKPISIYIGICNRNARTTQNSSASLTIEVSFPSVRPSVRSFLFFSFLLCSFLSCFLLRFRSSFAVAAQLCWLMTWYFYFGIRIRVFTFFWAPHCRLGFMLPLIWD